MAITALPDAPTREDPEATFVSKSNAFVAALPAFVTEANALQTDVNAKQITTSAAAVTAVAASESAVGAANYQGDYDAGTTYTVGQSVSNGGKIWAAKRTVTGVTPVEGDDWFQVTLDLVTKPSNVSPAASATDLGSGPTLTGSEYGSLYGLTQAASQWQVSTAADFSTTVVSTGDVAGVGVTYTVPSGTLSVSTTYYWRCRYKDPNGVYSDWSDGTSFTTAASFFPSSEVAKIVASDAAAGDEFGYSSAIDGTYAIVGANGEDAGGANAGSVYIFERSGAGTWSQVQKLQASDAQADDYFGSAVAISGNYAVVGAYGEDTGGSTAGSVYIFERSGAGTWSQMQKIQASVATASDSFGISVAIDGTRIIVGAMGAVGSTGAAYIFTLSGGTWTQTIKLTASDAATSDTFGRSVSISGSYAIVGAEGEDTTGSNAGSAYFYELDGTWSQVAKVQASDADAGDNFGFSVSISGNYAVVGALAEDAGGSNAGAAYIFERSGAGTWSQVAKVQASNPATNAFFGYSVSISGSFAIVGAYGTTNGTAYVFERSGAGTWSQVQILTASDAQSSDRFGYSVGISGSYAVVGASFEDTGGDAAGAAYIYE